MNNKSKNQILMLIEMWEDGHLTPYGLAVKIKEELRDFPVKTVETMQKSNELNNKLKQLNK
tara:strand:- start:2181 stop:2363 length:183 start_codon:yes stop_codon:yes gene_type:complete